MVSVSVKFCMAELVGAQKVGREGEIKVIPGSNCRAEALLNQSVRAGYGKHYFKPV